MTLDVFGWEDSPSEGVIRTDNMRGAVLERK